MCKISTVSICINRFMYLSVYSKYCIYLQKTNFFIYLCKISTVSISINKFLYLFVYSKFRNKLEFLYNSSASSYTIRGDNYYVRNYKKIYKLYIIKKHREIIYYKKTEKIIEEKL